MHAGAQLENQGRSYSNLRCRQLGGRTQLIADSAYGVNQLRGMAIVNLAAQVVDINVDHVRGGIERKVPYVFNNHGASYSASGVEQQVFEQTELLPSQIDSATAAFHQTLHAVELKVGSQQHGLRRQVTAAHQRPNAGGKFTEGKWLGQVVVRARIQALYAVFHSRTLGQHQHRQARFLRA